MTTRPSRTLLLTLTLSIGMSVSTSGWAKESSSPPSEELRLAQSVTDDPTKQLAVYWKLKALDSQRKADWYKAQMAALLVQHRELKADQEKERRRSKGALGAGIAIGVAVGLVVAALGVWGAGLLKPAAQSGANQ